MKKSEPRKDILIKHTLKKEDKLELPMDDAFYEKLHDRIMSSVEKAEMETPRKWAKTRVFLEPQRPHQPPTKHEGESRHLPKKTMKLAFIGLLTSFGIGYLGVSQQIYADLQPDSNAKDSKSSRIYEARKSPQETKVATHQKSKLDKS